MELAYVIGLLVLGFAILLKCADWFVDGACSLAKKMGLSEIMIGLTVVAFGTSAPELVVNLAASIKGDAAGITFGNIVGSNISNILLILGICAVIRPIRTAINTAWKEIPFAILSCLVLLVLANDMFVQRFVNFNQITNGLSKHDGIILLGFFVIFLIYVMTIAKKSGIEAVGQHEETVKPISWTKTWIYLVIGLAGMVIGGKLIVDNAVELAHRFGVSDKLIGLTIVAIGTSLPELATSAVAVYKGKDSIAMGNIVGSNIFNVFFILGISLCIQPIPFADMTTNAVNVLGMFSANVDLFVVLGASFMLFLTMFTGQKKVVDRWEGVLLLVAYIGYTAYLIYQK